MTSLVCLVSETDHQVCERHPERDRREGAHQLDQTLDQIIDPAAEEAGDGLKGVCQALGIPPVLHMGSCVDISRILVVCAAVADALGVDISDLPVAGAAPEWMSEKAISIGHYFVASGVYTVFGVTLPVSGAPVFKDYLFREFEKMYGGMWDLEVDPIKHARKMIAHIDRKRSELGIDRARERIMVDMAARRELESA